MSIYVCAGGAFCLLASAMMAGMAANRDRREMDQPPGAEQPQAAHGDDGAGSNPEETTAPLVFSGGYDADPGGRPVVLVAGALGVAPEVFREAFRAVRPARGGQAPKPEQVRQNKAALLRVLAKHGVTNERLDEVSDYYRYDPRKGEKWPTKPAKGYALIENGKIKGFVITAGGSGYSSPPRVTVKGMPDVTALARLTFSKDFDANGSVVAISLVEPDVRWPNSGTPPRPVSAQ